MRFFSQLFRRFREHDIIRISGSVAFQLILSIVPCLLFVTWLLQILGFQPKTALLSAEISHWLPDGFIPLTETLLSVLNQTEHPTGWALAGLALAAWSGSSGFSAIIKGLLTAYRVKKHPSFLVIRLRSVILMITFGLIMSAAFSLVSDGEQFLTVFLHLPFGQVLIPFFQWSAGWLLVFTAVAFLYVFAPSLNLTLKSVLPGSFLFSVSWVFSTWGLNEILAYLVVFKQTLNVLGSTALLMIWMYLTSLLLLAGGEINAIKRNRVQSEKRRK
ncbi:MAG: YihY/virulence factor BrkB family protein [Bacteroidetes bacterium]|nr:YihY/virulence factor BrkB family protein [Bacteroidota bacterium]